MGEAALAAATQIRTAKAEEAAKEEAEAEAAKAAEEARRPRRRQRPRPRRRRPPRRRRRAAAEAAGEGCRRRPRARARAAARRRAEAPAPIVGGGGRSPADGASLLLGHWRTLEKEFVSKAAAALGTVRLLQWKGVQRQSGARKELLELLQAADPRQSEVVEAQAAFNSMPTALRMEAAGKGELHALVEALLEKLWGHSDSKREAAEALLAGMKADEWQEQQAHRLVLALVDLAQAEVDRFAATCSVAADYCALRAEARVPPPPPGTLPEPVTVEVPAALEAGAAEAKLLEVIGAAAAALRAPRPDAAAAARRGRGRGGGGRRGGRRSAGAPPHRVDGHLQKGWTASAPSSSAASARSARWGARSSPTSRRRPRRSTRSWTRGSASA